METNTDTIQKIEYKIKSQRTQAAIYSNKISSSSKNKEQNNNNKSS